MERGVTCTTGRHRRRNRVSRGPRGGTRAGRLLPISLLSILLVLAAAAPRVNAQTRSPGLGPSRITVIDPIGQGEEVEIPPLSVSNRAEERRTFAVDITFVGDQEELIPDPSWFRMEPQQFELEPGARQIVEVRMAVPRDAEVGDYRVLLRARTVQTADAGEGVAISPAVATVLRFSVRNVNFHFYDPLVDFYRDRSPFSWIGSALLAAVGAGYLFQLRYGIDLDFGLNVRKKE